MSKLVAFTMLASLSLAAPLAAQQASPAAPQAKASKYDRIVCKTMKETGSLIRKKKTCKSIAAWDKEAEAMRANGVSDACRARAEGGSCL